MQRSVRDDKYKLGLLKPDTFAEDRLLRQPPGVCIMLVMYNRYHNYVATQLRRINENGRFSVPLEYRSAKPVAVAKKLIPAFKDDANLKKYLEDYQEHWKNYRKNDTKIPVEYTEDNLKKMVREEMEKLKQASKPAIEVDVEKFEKAYDAAWNKLDDDLFNTARL